MSNILGTGFFILCNESKEILVKVRLTYAIIIGNKSCDIRKQKTTVTLSTRRSKAKQNMV